MIEIEFKKYAAKKLEKILKKNKQLSEKITETLLQLKQDPFAVSLHTHKVNSKLFGQMYSSRITGDLRFIWDFDERTMEIVVIEIFDIGGHSGENKVY